jgi:hypothetical protein
MWCERFARDVGSAQLEGTANLMARVMYGGGL